MASGTQTALSVAAALAAYKANPAGPPIAISDNATNIITNIGALSPLIAAGAVVSVTINASNGSVNTVTAAQAQTLSGLPAIGLATGAILKISDSVTQMLAGANAAGFALANSLTVTGQNTVTAAQAQTLAKHGSLSVASGASLVISDSAANVLSASNSNGLGVATAIVVTGTQNTVTAAQATTLANNSKVTLASGTQLTIVDSAVNLTGTSFAKGVALATALVMSGQNTLTVAAGLALLGLPHPVSFASGASLVIQDMAQNLVQANGAYYSTTEATLFSTLASKVLIIGLGTVSTVQANAIAQIPNIGVTAGAGLAVTDSYTNLFALSPAAAALTLQYHLNQSATVDAATAVRLGALANFALVAGSGGQTTILTVSDTAAALYANITTNGFTKAGARVVNASATVSAAVAARIAASGHASLGAGVVLTVADTTSNLLANPNAGALQLGNAFVITGNNTVTAAQLATLAALPSIGLGSGATDVVADTAAAIGSAIDALQAETAQGLVTGITLSGSTAAKPAAVTISGAQYIADARALALITSPHTLVVQNAGAAQVASLNADTLVSGYSLNDTSSAVNALLDSLPNLAKLSSITLADSTGGVVPTLTVPYAVYVADATTVFPKIASAYTLVVTGAPDSAAATLQADARVAGFALTDSAAAILGDAALRSDSKLTGVTLSAGSSATVTAAQACMLAALHTTLGSGVRLTLADSAAAILANPAGTALASAVQITGSNTVSVAQAQGLAALPNVSLANGASLTVADGLDTLLATNPASLGLATATTIASTGPGETISAAQAEQLTAFTHIAVGAGVQLVVADNTANVLAGANAAGVALATSVVVTDTAANIGANLAALNALPNASYSISDTSAAVNALLNSQPNLAKLGAITLTDSTGGTVPTLTLTYAAYLADAAQFAKITSAYSLVVTGAPDSAAAALQADPRVSGFAVSDLAAVIATDPVLGGDSKLTGVTFTSGNATVSAAQASAIAALHISLGAGSTLTVQDSAAAILANPAGDAIANGFVITGANTVTVAQGRTLAGLPNARLASGATLTVADSLDALLATNAGALGLATATQIVSRKSGETVTAAQAEQLSALPGIGVASGVGLVIADTAANVLKAANAAGVALATEVDISDTGTNIINGLSGLSALPNLGTITPTDGTAFYLSGAQYAAGTSLFSRISGGDYTIFVHDATASQVAAINADPHVTNLTIVDSVGNINANLDAINTAIAAKNKYGQEFVYGLTINSGYTDVITGATSFTIDLSKLTTYNARSLAHDIFNDRGYYIYPDNELGLYGKTIDLSAVNQGFNNAPNYNYPISGVYKIDAQAIIFNIQDLTSALVYNITMNDINILLNALGINDGQLAQNIYNTITGNPNSYYGDLSYFFGTDTQYMRMTISGAQYANDSLAISVLSGAAILGYDGQQKATLPHDPGAMNYQPILQLTVQGISAAQVATVAKDSHVVAFTVADSAAAVIAALGSLQTSARAGTLTAISLTDGGTPTLSITGDQYDNDAAALNAITSPFNLVVTNAHAADAAALAADPRVVGFTVVEWGNLIGQYIDSLQAAYTSGKMTALTVTAAFPIGLTYTQYVNDAAVIGAIQGQYTLNVSGASVAQAATLAADPRVGGFTITDSSNAVFAALDTLQADPALTTITTTDSAPQVIGYATFAADAATIAKIASPVSVIVTDALAAGAGALNKASHVQSYAVVDSAAQVAAQLNALEQGLAKLSTITLTDAGMPTLTISDAQYNADKAVLGLITTPFTLDVTGAPVGDALGNLNNPGVASVTISDTSAAVFSHLDALNGDPNLTAITLTDAGSARPQAISYASYVGDTQALALINGTYSVDLSGANAAQAVALTGDPHLDSVAVDDTASAILGSAAGLIGLGAKLGQVTITDSETVTIAQAASLAGLGAVLAAGQTLNVAASASDVAANLDALNAYAQISEIDVTDGADLTISYKQSIVDANALNEVTGYGSLIVREPTISGGASFATLDGTGGYTVLRAGTGGANLLGGTYDTLNANKVGKDTFTFQNGGGVTIGNETINGFSLANDTLDFKSGATFGGLATAAAVLGATVQSGANLVITDDQGDSITLTNLSLTAFKAQAHITF